MPRMRQVWRQTAVSAFRVAAGPAGSNGRNVGGKGWGVTLGPGALNSVSSSWASPRLGREWGLLTLLQTLPCVSLDREVEAPGLPRSPCSCPTLTVATVVWTISRQQPVSSTDCVIASHCWGCTGCYGHLNPGLSIARAGQFLTS